MHPRLHSEHCQPQFAQLGKIFNSVTLTLSANIPHILCWHTPSWQSVDRLSKRPGTLIDTFTSGAGEGLGEEGRGIHMLRTLATRQNTSAVKMGIAYSRYIRILMGWQNKRKMDVTFALDVIFLPFL